jgi:restriction system protein
VSVIRAKFVENPRSSVLLSLDPFQFELLIDALYRKMGYKATLTQRTYDRGRDIIAERECAGQREKVLVQCKRKKKTLAWKMLELYWELYRMRKQPKAF